MEWKKERTGSMGIGLTCKSGFVSNLLYIILVLGFILAWFYFNKIEMRKALLGYIVFFVFIFLAFLYFKYVRRGIKR